MEDSDSFRIDYTIDYTRPIVGCENIYFRTAKTQSKSPRATMLTNYHQNTVFIDDLAMRLILNCSKILPIETVMSV